MYKDYTVIEVTKENEEQYLQGIVELEEIVLNKMEQDGKIGQLFITGEEGIKEYINSNSNHVIIAVKNNENNTTISAAYITQGQVDFTYNDITKYFKCDANYQKYVRTKYPDTEFEKAIREVYIEKICAFKYARDIVLKESNVENLTEMDEKEKNNVFLKMVEQEYNDPQNQFHEKSEIRDSLNKYMSLYMKYIKKDIERYQDFYWIDFDYLKRNLNEDIGNKMKGTSEFCNFDVTMDTYDKVLQYQKYKIYDKSHCNDISKYYSANTSNTIELDTYITHPENRENGIARILTFEGIKKSVETVLKNENNKEVFLVSTLHQENLSSKYVSEFFGLKDYLFVNRRNGRDRQVHINMIPREKADEYIANMEKKIAVLYNYNPNNIFINREEKIKILKDQINYEVGELGRLNAIKDIQEKKKYTGYIRGKQCKIEGLRKLVKKLEGCEKSNNKGEVSGFENGKNIEIDDIPLL